MRQTHPGIFRSGGFSCQDIPRRRPCRRAHLRLRPCRRAFLRPWRLAGFFTRSTWHFLFATRKARAAAFGVMNFVRFILDIRHFLYPRVPRVTLRFAIPIPQKLREIWCSALCALQALLLPTVCSLGALHAACPCEQPCVRVVLPCVRPILRPCRRPSWS